MEKSRKAVKRKDEKGKQLDLIDVHPKEAKPIIEAARVYKKYQAKRLDYLKKETDQKKLIIELVEKAKLQKLAGGVVKFEYDNVKVTITPRDELVKVTEKDEE